jgi:KilA-N domain
MAKKKKVTVEGTEISFFDEDEAAYISLTDIARQSSDEPRFVIRNWMSTQNSIAYLGGWESLHNPNFNRAGFRTFRDDFFEKPFSLTPSRWIELTNPIGIRSKAGKEGGTFAHRDIAMNFCYWLSCDFFCNLTK